MNRSSLSRPARLLCAAGIAVVLAACQGRHDTAAAPQQADASPAPASAAPPVSLIPLPASVEHGEGRFDLSAATPLLAEGEGARAVATQFATLLAKGFAVEPALADGTGVAGAIRFAIDPARAAAGTESYLL